METTPDNSIQVKLICIAQLAIFIVAASQKIMMLVFVISSSLMVAFNRLELSDNIVYTLR